jgi:hypothetical protein
MLIFAVLEHTNRKTITLSYCTCSFVVPSFAMLKRAIPFLSCLFYSIIQVHPQAPDHRILYSARISFQSSELGPSTPAPHPHPQRNIAPLHPFGSKGRHTHLQGRGWVPNFDKGTDNLILYLYYNPLRS